MTHTEKEFVKQLVFKACAEDPAMLRQVIDIATEGVKSFADSQSDIATKISFVLTQVLDQYPDVNQFGPFSRLEILDVLKRSFDGTPWYKKEMERLTHGK